MWIPWETLAWFLIQKWPLATRLKLLVNKCLRTLGFIKNVSRDFRCASTLVNLYKSLLLPILTYCSPICLPLRRLWWRSLYQLNKNFWDLLCALMFTTTLKYKNYSIWFPYEHCVFEKWLYISLQWIFQRKKFNLLSTKSTSRLY